MIAAYLLMLSLAGVVFPPATNAPGFVASVLGLSAVLVVVCWWKGERPKLALGSVRAGRLFRSRRNM